MHFLCLHGVGTNSKILEMQTAALRYELGDGHTYDYAEGTTSCGLAPEVRHFGTNDGSGYSYYELSNSADVQKPVQDIEKFIATEGPYDGVIAFSQGIVLAGSVIIRSIQRGDPAPFKCAIFFSPRMGPLDLGESERAGRPVEVDPKVHGGILPVPTTLIWGENDPDKIKAVEIQGLFVPEKLTTYVHQGGHEIPGAGSNYEVIKCANAVRRTIDAATDARMN